MASSTQEWIDELKSISVLELSERIKALEEEFGVSAAAVAAAAPAGGGGGGDGDGAQEEEQSAFNVVFTAPATRRSRSSRSCARRPASASRRPRRSSTRPPRPSRRASTATRPTSSRASWRKPGRPSRSSNRRALSATDCRTQGRPIGAALDVLTTLPPARPIVAAASAGPPHTDAGRAGSVSAERPSQGYARPRARLIGRARQASAAAGGRAFSLPVPVSHSARHVRSSRLGL